MSSFEKISPEASGSQDVGDVRRLVRFGVRNQVGEKQPDRGLAAQTVRHVLRFSRGNDVIVSSVKQEDRSRGRWRS
jgi:hypothetical protein